MVLIKYESQAAFLEEFSAYPPSQEKDNNRHTPTHIVMAISAHQGKPAERVLVKKAISKFTAGHEICFEEYINEWRSKTDIKLTHFYDVKEFDDYLDVMVFDHTEKEIIAEED